MTHFLWKCLRFWFLHIMFNSSQKNLIKNKMQNFSWVLIYSVNNLKYFWLLIHFWWTPKKRMFIINWCKSFYTQYFKQVPIQSVCMYYCPKNSTSKLHVLILIFIPCQWQQLLIITISLCTYKNIIYNEKDDDGSL